MAISKIDDKVLENEKRYHACQSDVPGKKASEMKAFMDYVPRSVIIPKINEIIDETSKKVNKGDVYNKTETDELLNRKWDSDKVYTKDEMDAALSKKANVDNVYEKDDAKRTFAEVLKGNAYGKMFTVNDALSINHALSMKLVSKNRIPSGYVSKTVDGVTFDVQADGSVVLNGTSTKTSDIKYELTQLLPFEAGTYFMSGCPTGGSADKYWLTVINSNGSNYSLYKIDVGQGFLLDLKEPENLKFYIRIAPGTVLNNVVFKPMFEKSKTRTEYTSYVSNFLGYSTYVDFYQDGVMTHGYSCISDRFGKVESLATESTEFKVEVTGEGVVVSIDYLRDINKTIDKILRSIT